MGAVSLINPVNSIETLSGIGALNSSSVVKNADKVRDSKVNESGFDSIFKGYLGLLRETDAYQISADKAQVDFVTGKTDDMAAVLLAQEKAYASLNFTVQVTNKILDAYHEIMRISM